MTRLIITYGCGRFSHVEDVTLCDGETYRFENYGPVIALEVGWHPPVPLMHPDDWKPPRVRLRFFNLARVEVVET